MADLTGATLADFQEQGTAPRAEFVGLGDQMPDITKHDPNTFAGLTAQSALKTLYQQGLQPTGDDIKGVYSKALQDATEYHRNLAQEQERANLELQKRQTAITSGTLTAEEKARATVEAQKQMALEQFRQGPSAVQAAQQQGGQGLVSRLPDTDLQRLDGYVSAYDTVKNLHGYFNNMVQNTAGAGGVLKKGVEAFFTQPGMTSPQYRAFNSYLESSIVPLGRGVFGDAAVAATKENIQNQMKDMLPNPTDNDASGGQKVFMLKDRIMQNLQTLRDDRANSGYDTTPIDKKIAEFNSDFRSDNTQKYNPLGGKANQLVQSGVSLPATANMDAQLVANANVQAAQMQSSPGGSASAWAQPQQPAQPQPQPQIQPAQTPSQFYTSGSD